MGSYPGTTTTSLDGKKKPMSLTPPGPHPLLAPRGSLPRRRGLLLLLGWLVLAGGASPGSAPSPVLHTELQSSIPARDAVVEEPVAELRLRFTTEVQLPLSRITVGGPGGAVFPGTLGMVEDSGRRELRFVLEEPLPPGPIRVSWQTAGPDGHVIRGEYGFTVAGPSPGPEVPDTGKATPPPQEPPPSPDAEPAFGDGSVGLAVRWLQYLGTLLILGAVAFRLGVLPGLGKESALAPAVSGMSARLPGFALTGAVLLALSMPGRLWVQSVNTWGAEALAAGNLATLIFRTPWGWGWMIQGGALILVVLGLRLTAPAGGRAAGWSVAGIGALAAALVPAFSGHAWGISPRGLGVALSAGHILGAGVWLGGLAAMLLVGLPALKAVKGEDGTLPGLPALVNGFSRLALPAVLLVVLTGAGQNFIHLGGNPGHLVTTPWGRALLVKLGLVAGAFALGLYNWRVVRPALQGSPRPGLLRIPATVELLLGLAVLAATAVLVVQSLPASGGP